MMEQKKAVSSSKRMDWLDTTRGFAMLLVFWGHIASRSSRFHNAIYCFSKKFFAIMAIHNLSKKEKERLGALNRMYYDSHFSLEEVTRLIEKHFTK